MLLQYGDFFYNVNRPAVMRQNEHSFASMKSTVNPFTSLKACLVQIHFQADPDIYIDHLQKYLDSENSNIHRLQAGFAIYQECDE